MTFIAEYKQIRLKKALLLIILICSSLFDIYGSTYRDIKESDIYRYQMNNGISSNHIEAIIQDSLGYIWVASAGGLDRFDGQKFDNFIKLEDLKGAKLSLLIDGTTLLTGRKSIDIVERGAADSREVECLDIITASAPSSTSEHSAWIAYQDSGIYILDSKKLITYPSKFNRQLSNSLLGREISSILESSPPNNQDNRDVRELWLGGDGSITSIKLDSLSQIDGKPITFTSCIDGRAIEGKIIGIFKDYRSSDILFYTNAAIYRYSYRDQDIYLVDFNIDRAHSHKRIGDELKYDIIKSISQDRSGRLYISSYYNIHIGDYNSKSCKIDYLKLTSKASSKPLPHDLINFAVPDRDRNIWVGCVGYGLYKIVTQPQPFRHIDVDPSQTSFINSKKATTVAANIDNSLWVGTYNVGVKRISINRDRADINYSTNSDIDNYTISEIELPYSNEITAVTCDSYGDTWCSETTHGLYKLEYSSSTIELKNYPTTESIESIHEGKFRDIESRKIVDGLFLGTNSGLLFFNRESNKFINIPIVSDSKIATIGSIIQTDISTLWLGAKRVNGLYKLNIESGVLESVSLPKEVSINDMLYSDNFIYIATDRDGLLKLNTQTKEITVAIDSDQGLLDNTIFSIVMDRQGDIWMSGNLGITRFTPINSRVKLFRASSGVQNGYFFTKSRAISRSGEVAFGGFNGVSIAATDSIDRDSRDNQLDIVSVTSDTTEIDYPIDTIVVEGGTPITVNLSSIYTLPPYNSKYRYALIPTGSEPLSSSDTVWQEVTQPSIKIDTPLSDSSLSSSYTLKIRSSRYDDWGTNERSLTIVTKERQSSSITDNIYILFAILLTAGATLIWLLKYRDRYSRKDDGVEDSIDDIGSQSSRKQTIEEAGSRTDLVHLDSKFIKDIELYIKENIANTDLNIDMLCSQFALSRSGLLKKVKQNFGATPLDLIKGIRLDEAIRLLIDSDKTISDISYFTGFSSPSYFTKVFTIKFKQSPKKFRSNYNL